MGGQQHKTPHHKRLRWFWLIGLVLAIIFVGLLVWLIVAETQRQDQAIDPQATQNNSEEEPASVPQLSTEVIVDNRQNIWDVGFLPSGEMLFTERRGAITLQSDGQLHLLTEISDVYAVGEGGLMGLAVDPNFNDNRYIYTCFNSDMDGLDVRVARWELSDDLASLKNRTDIITGAPSNTSGRHSGCRLAFGADDYLWIATGDAAQGENPQNPKSLGGKILRVNRDGQPAESGNLGGDFDPRIYSYGHRNSQGLAMLDSPINGVYGVSTEHGPSVDDEVNSLKSGNFGWNPTPGYNESVPMTDLAEYPDAVSAIWSSGRPTQAISGAVFVYGSNWGAWDGMLFVTALKDQKLKVFELDDNLQAINSQDIFTAEFGRLRAVVQGPDKNLYLTTDNGNNDKIIRVTPN